MTMMAKRGKNKINDNIIKRDREITAKLKVWVLLEETCSDGLVCFHRCLVFPKYQHENNASRICTKVS